MEYRSHNRPEQAAGYDDTVAADDVAGPDRDNRHSSAVDYNAQCQ